MMLRRILIASAGAAAISGAALAADVETIVPPRVYLPPPVPLLWTGFYLGVNAGGTWSSNNAVDTVAFPGPCSCLTVPTISATGAALANFSVSRNDNGAFIGGGQIGYNYQFSPSWVAGIEADIQVVAASTSNTQFNSALANPNFPTIPIFETADALGRVDYLGTARGRIGFLINRTLLIYGTGGLAYGGVHARTDITQTIGVAPPAFSSGSLNNTHAGWTAGGGAEWMFLPKWSVKAEYLYYDLGSVSYTLSPLFTGNAAAPVLISAFPHSTTRFNGNIVRAGLNYHFNWMPAPVAAMY
jgi:outer membrane immunogenic protein